MNRVDASPVPTTDRWPAIAAGMVLTLALLGLACGDGSDPDLDGAIGSASTVAADSPSSTPTNPLNASTSTSVATSAASTASTTSPAATTPDGDLPGDDWSLFAESGDRLAVLGVAHDDVLNVRSLPGTDGDIVATATSTADDLVATGRARMLPRSLWYEVTVDGATGWVSVGFVAFEGPTDDATAEFLAGGSLPTSETMQELGELVAAAFVSDEPPSEVVQSVAPTVGDLAEVTYDVVGLADDAGAGYRLHIFATPTEDGEGFVLASVERTEYCLRGVSGGYCV